MPSPKDQQAAKQTLWDTGLDIRRTVLGEDYVSRSLANGSTEFTRPLQELATEVGWGWIWARPGLERKQRSLINLAMLTALNRPMELAIHVRGALNNGLTETEIREVILQVGVYAGIPASMEGFRVAKRVLDEYHSEKAEKIKSKL